MDSHNKNWAKSTKYAVPLARARGTRPNKNKIIYTYSWKNWFKGVLD